LLRPAYNLLPAISGMIGTHYDTHRFSIEMEAHILFYPGCSGAMILLISAASNVASITSVSHGHLANTTSLPNGAGKLSIYVEKTET
jgi:hypothetical protein